MSRRNHSKLQVGPFAMLPVDVLRTQAWRTLPHQARSVLVVLAAQYSGRDNGSVTLTRRTATDYGLGRPETLYRSLNELQARGLIVRTRPGTRIPPRSAMYALTWRQINEPLRHDPHDVRPTLAPSHTYASWTATRSGPHWTSGRRLPRYRMVTSASTASEHVTAQMSTASGLTSDRARVPHAYSSHISALGQASIALARQRKRSA